MDSISEQIRAKKNEIKRLNRELSELQDEAKKDNMSRWVKINSCTGIAGENLETVLRLESNKTIEYSEIETWVKSLNGGTEKSSPDWDSFSPLDWACKDDAGKWHYANSKQALMQFDTHFLVHRNAPKSYVDWDKIDKKYNWVAADRDGEVWGYKDRPFIRDDQWAYGGKWETFGFLYHGINDKSWDKSLIHRPGIKE